MLTVNGNTTGTVHPLTGYCQRCDKFYVNELARCRRLHDPSEPACVNAPCPDCVGEALDHGDPGELLVLTRANSPKDQLDALGRELVQQTDVVKNLARLAAEAAPREEDDDDE